MMTEQEPSRQGEPCQHPYTADRRLVNMIKLTTLLGTYSLNEHERVLSQSHQHSSSPNDKVKKNPPSSLHHHPNGQIEKLLIASSCDALRAMVNYHQTCSFPALELESSGTKNKARHRHHCHCFDHEQQEASHDPSGFSRKPCTTSSSTASTANNSTRREQVHLQTSALLGRPILVNSSTDSDATSTAHHEIEDTIQKNFSVKVCSTDGEDKHPDQSSTHNKRKRIVPGPSFIDKHDAKRLCQEQIVDTFTEPVQVVDCPNETSPSSPGCKREEQDARERDATIIHDIAKVPFLMMFNFSTSFAQLIEARIRAHCNFLQRYINSLNGPGVCPFLMAKHGKCPTKTEVKLNTLLMIAESMEIHGVVTTFHADTQADSDNGKRKEHVVSEADEGHDEMVNLPIVFEAIVDLGIPRLDDGECKSEEHTVSIKCPGNIIGCYEKGSDSVFEFVKLDLDTNALMSQMIDKACEVVQKLISSTNTFLSEIYKSHEDMVVPEKKTLPFVQKNEMLPPPQQQHSPVMNHALVTPDLKPKTPGSPQDFPSKFSLDSSIEEGVNEDSQSSSDDDCAALIDYAIGDFSS